jgi:hypothetical protein
VHRGGLAWIGLAVLHERVTRLDAIARVAADHAVLAPSEDRLAFAWKRHDPGVERCGARATFWPDVETIEVECDLERGHEGPHHGDVGEWWDDELPTEYPADDPE